MQKRTYPRGFDTRLAHQHLCGGDPRFASCLAELEAIDADPRWQQPFDPVDALARAICFQQLSGKAAATIVGRGRRPSAHVFWTLQHWRGWMMARCVLVAFHGEKSGRYGTLAHALNVAIYRTGLRLSVCRTRT